MKLLTGLCLAVIATCQISHADAQTTVEYYHTDALGSVVAISNASGSVVERNEYEPFGADLTGMKDGPGYTGHVADAATGLDYMQQRYYDPTIGRFLSVDPVTADSTFGGNFNRYKYAANNPYRFTDPDGRLEKVTGSHIAGAPFAGARIGLIGPPSVRASGATSADSSSESSGNEAPPESATVATPGQEPSAAGELILRMLAGSVAANANMKSTHPDRIEQDDANKIAVQTKTITLGGAATIASTPAAGPAVSEGLAATGIPANANTLREIVYATCIALGCAQGGRPSGARVRQEERILQGREGNLRESRRDNFELPEPKP